jgi:hypothetical protein
MKQYKEAIEKELETRSKQIETKQNKSKAVLNTINTERQRQLELKRNEDKNKSKQHSENLKQCKRRELSKTQSYFLKQDKIQKNLEQVNEDREWRYKRKARMNEDKLRTNKNLREKLDEEENKKKQLLQKRMVDIDKRLNENKEKVEFQNQKKVESRKIKQFYKNKIIERQRRVQENENKKKMKDLEDKDKKIAEYKDKKASVAEEKQNAVLKIQKEKEDVINRFEKLLKQKSNVDCEIVKELFPEDETFYNKIKELQESYTNKSGNVNDSNNKSQQQHVQLQLEGEINNVKATTEGNDNASINK